MPEVETVETTRAVSAPARPGATPPEADTLAGTSMASDGRLVPSGRTTGSAASASAVPALLVVAMLAVQAAESTASGTSASALWPRPKRVGLPVVDISFVTPAPSAPGCGPLRPG